MSTVRSLKASKYRHHKGSGQAIVTIAGQDFYLGNFNTAASREEYRRLVGEWLQTGAAPGEDRQQEITVVEVIVAYTRFARGYYLKNGKPTREYEKVVEVGRYIKPLYGRTLAAQFGPLALKAVRQSMIDTGLSRKYINKNIERARRMFKWVAGEELIPAGVPQSLAMVAGLKKGRTEARETAPVLPVDDKAVDATLEHLPAVVADMVRLQRHTAMRPAEVCIIRPVDLDRSGDVWIYRPAVHKTDHLEREHPVFIGPQGQRVLLRYLARDPEAYCFQPRDSEAKRLAARHADRKTPLSCGNTPGTNRQRKPKRTAGAYYTTCTYRRAIYRACDKAFPWPKLAGRAVVSLSADELAETNRWQKSHRWSPGRLRHMMATAVRQQFGLEAAQVIWVIHRRTSRKFTPSATC